MRLLSKIKPEFPLRLGLAGTFLYSGWNLLQNPADWVWALDEALLIMPIPLRDFITESVGKEQFLQFQGGIELGFVALLLMWFLPKSIFRFAAAAITLEFAGILLATGIDSITFRDIGLIGAAAALSIIAYKK